jgi:hypothetical protein
MYFNKQGGVERVTAIAFRLHQQIAETLPRLYETAKSSRLSFSRSARTWAKSYCAC